VIVRIATEGQYDLGESALPELHELDSAAVAAGEAGDEASFHDVYARLLDYIRSHGSIVPDDGLVRSELILPPPDITLEEAREEFSGEGLIPD
jgi:hypothetical protein